MTNDVVVQPTNTGVYYSGHFFRLSTPFDLLRFTALPFIDRIRLGLLTLRARHVKDWKSLEHETAADWLRRLGGDTVFRVVWEPLLIGKFGPYAEKVSAVWFWNKLKLRGGSRGKGGEERLAYMKGSFARLAEATAAGIESAGGKVVCRAPVTRISPLENGRWQVCGPWGEVESDKVIVTTALPLVADMVESWATPEYLSGLRRINYLANVCLVLQLDRSLSSTYWLNVNDPSFPFVGVIEHTNFESASSYGGNHIVYLSKYLPHTDALYKMSAKEILDFSMPYLQKMFPAFSSSWIRHYDVWKARWSQPVVEKEYSALIPPQDGPRPGFYLCSMAQIYPEDRGTNYAIREGRRLAARLINT
ncbi:NAD(P)/FAD-dependent oxidoreductase [Acetobacter lovaniensis]|uniref:Protoporphyrinogen oxidase n=1 Tax=Acetobacter lovaniensis TaxID=104100 RepID=A0A841QEL5_9PROT|nr:protoporphyrinogen oxidase [Acetobacter lovaniensis]